MSVPCGYCERPAVANLRLRSHARRICRACLDPQIATYESLGIAVEPIIRDEGEVIEAADRLALAARAVQKGEPGWDELRAALAAYEKVRK